MIKLINGMVVNVLLKRNMIKLINGMVVYVLLRRNMIKLINGRGSIRTVEEKYY